MECRHKGDSDLYKGNERDDLEKKNIFWKESKPFLESFPYPKRGILFWYQYSLEKK